MAPFDAEWLRAAFHYDPLTGVFLRRTPVKGARVGDVVGTRDKGYLKVVIRYKPYALHRLAWLYITGEWPLHEIDHINGISDDNRFANLRDVPRRVNAENMRSARSHNKLGVQGVKLHPKSGRYEAYIRVHGKYKFLGCHDSAVAANAAYLTAKRSMHEGCTL